jgi:hypothetical protein
MRRRTGSRLRCLALIVAAAVGAPACGGESVGAGDGASLEDMIAAVPRVRLVEELRLDAEAEDFSVVGGFVAGPDGRIAVPLRQDYEVRLYDADGTRTATVGRHGSGPGEFQALGNLGWVGDTLWTFDSRLRSLAWFATDGTLLRAVPWPAGIRVHDPAIGGAVGDLAYFTPVAVFGDGSMLGDGRFWTERNGNRAISPSTFTLTRLDGDATVVVTPVPFEDPRWMLEVAGFGQPVPFTMRPQSSATPDGSRLATLHTETQSADGGVLVLALYSWPESLAATAPDAAPGSGEPVLTRTYAFRGQPIPRAAMDSALDAFMPPPGRPREGPENLPQRFQALARERMPSIYTPVVALRLGVDDTIWFVLQPTAEERVSLILDGRGEPIATVATPVNVVIRQSSATHVWATERDEYGLNSVVRYRIEGL